MTRLIVLSQTSTCTDVTMSLHALATSCHVVLYITGRVTSHLFTCGWNSSYMHVVQHNNSIIIILYILTIIVT